MCDVFHMEYGDYFGMKISRVCLGCVSFSGYDYGPMTDDNCKQIVRTALEVGINCFDTSDIYGFGRSEEILGEALMTSDNAIIITKFGLKKAGNAIIKDLNPKEIKERLEGSLRRLKRDYVDIYLIHWYDGRIQLDDVIDELLTLKASGKIRAMGCSNFDSQLLSTIQKVQAIEALQMPYNLAQLEHEELLFEAANKRHCFTMAYNVLLQGLFSGKYDTTSRFYGTDIRARSSFFQDGMMERNLKTLEKLNVLATKYKKTTAQIAIRYVLDSGCIACAIVGAKTQQQVMDNANIGDFRLSKTDLEFLVDRESL